MAIENSGYIDLKEFNDSFTFENEIITPGHEKRYKFTVSENTVCTFSLSGEDCDYLSWQIFDSNGEEIYFDSELTELAPGTYYCNVYSYNDVNCNFALNFEKAEDLGAIKQNSSFDIKHNNYNKNSDIYTFSLDAKTFVDINVSGTSNYSYLTVFNSNGEEIYFDQNLFLDARKYFVQIDGEYSDLGSYNLDFITPADLGTVTNSVSFDNSNGKSQVKTLSFNISKGGLYDIEMLSKNESYFTLYNSNGEEIYYDTCEYLEAGKYYVKIDSYYDEYGYYDNAYTFNVQKIVSDRAEKNDSFETAYDLGEISSFNIVKDMSFHSAYDPDFYKVTITQDSIWTISTSQYEQDIRIYDKNYNEIYLYEYNPVLKAGEYFIEVNSYAPDTYSLYLNKAATLTLQDTYTQANFTYSGSYEFTLSEDCMLNIFNAEQDFYDVSFSIFDADGNMVDAPHYNYILEKGKYYISAEGYSYDEYGDSEFSIYFVKAEKLGTLTDTISFSASDYTNNYEFNLTEDGTWLIGTDSEFCDIDIYDVNGEYIYLEDNNNYLEAGKYFIQVNVHDAEYASGYNLYFTSVKPDYAENNDSMQSAYDLGTISESQTFNNLTIHNSEDKDYYKFTLTEDAVLDISSSDENMYFDIYTADGNYFYPDHNNPLFKAGTYFIKSENYEISSYSLNFSAAEKVGAISSSHNFAGTIASNEKQYYEFTIAENSMYQINSGNTYYNLYNSDGEEIWLEDYTYSFLAAGKYYLNIIGPEGDYYNQRQKDYNIEFKGAANLGTLTDSITVNSEGVFEFNIAESGTWDISINNSYYDYYDYEMYLYNANGEEIYLYDNENYLAAGKYFISVNSYDYNSDISFNIDRISPDFAEDNNNIQTAYDFGTLTDSVTYENLTLHNYDDKDYYKFTISETDLWQIGGNFNFDDISFEILDGNRETIYSTEDSDMYLLTAGTYYISIEGYECVEKYSLDLNKSEGLGVLTETTQINVSTSSDLAYKFTVSETGTWDIDTNSESTYYLLYNESGEEVYLYDNNFVLNAGTYYICIPVSAEYEHDYKRDITLTLENIKPDIYDSAANNDTIYTAADLGEITGDKVFADLSLTYNDTDFYKFTITEDGVWDIGLAKWSENISIEFFDSNGKSIEPEFGYFTPGTYFVNVQGYDIPENYSLKFESIKPDYAEDNNSIFTAYNLGTISESKTFSDFTFHSDTDTDYFKFTVTESGYWQISNGLGYDYGPYLYVTDANNEDIYSDESDYFYLDKGTYFIRTESNGYPEKYSIHLNKAENLGTIENSTEFNNLTSNDYYVTYEFNIAETGVWQISLTENNLPPWSDGGYSELYIRDSNGEEIYLWDGIPILNAGKYFISFTTYDENGSKDYNLKFTKAYDFGVIDTSTSVNNTIGCAQPQYYEFTLTESSMLNIYTTGTDNSGYEECSPINTTVRDANGDEIWLEENNLLTAGKYYISVYNEYMNYGDYDYSLVIEKAGNIEIVNNSFTIATTLDSYQKKYYEFTLTESSMYNISATDNGYGSIYSLINAAGEEIYLDENGYLNAGKYFMVLHDEYSDYGSSDCTVTLSQAQNLGTVETFTTFDFISYLNSGISDFSIEVDVTLPSDSTKYFEFTLAEDGFCNIGVFNSSDSAYYTLYDSNGEEVYYDYEALLLNAGKYYLGCSADSYYYDNKYHISISSAYNFGTVTETKSTEVMEYTPMYYQFTLNESQTVSIDIFSQYSSDDCYIYLYNENFEEVYSEYNEFDNEVYYLDAGKYYFKLSEWYGYNTVVSIKIPDLTPPEAPAAAQDITDITSGTVLVEASFSNDTVFKEYSFDGKKWMIYSEPVEVAQNGKVYFRGSDADGNQSDFTVHEVKNIDNTPPVISNIKADITGDTRTAVTISADFADDNNIVSKEYRIEGGEWQTYVDGAVMTFNGTVYFRATDVAGNTSEASHSINNIFAAERIFIKSSFNSDKITGKKQDGVTLVWHENAFESLELAQELLKNKNTSASEFIFLDSKVNFDNYENIDEITSTVAAVKEKGDINSNSYSRQESVTAKNTLNVNGKDAENIDFTNFATVNLTDSNAGEISGGKSSDSTTVKVSEKKGVKTVTETNNVSQTASGKVTATNSNAETLANYATVNLDGGYIGNIINNAYKLTETIKTIDGVKTTVNRTEKFTASGTVTLKNSAEVDNISNYKTVKITDSIVGTVESFAISKIVNNNPTYTLAGAVTLTASKVNTVRNYSKSTMTGSSVINIENVNKVTISKGFNFIESYTGTDGNDTLTIAKNAVLTLGTADFKAGTKDKLANNGTLILSAEVDISTLKISGKGEIAAASNVWHSSWDDYPIIKLGATSEGFRTTKYEAADNTAKKAAKWDLKAAHQGWLSGNSSCIDVTDFVKFKTGKESELLVVSGFDENDTIMLNGDKMDWKDGKFIAELAAKTNYTLELTIVENTDSMSYTLQLA